MTRMTLSASLELGQRTPASSVHIDKGLENQRVRTNASTPALVPLLAVLIAALPVPAHEDVLASLAAVTNFFSFQMGFRNESCVKIVSENVLSGVFTPGCHVALEDVPTSIISSSHLSRVKEPSPDMPGCIFASVLPILNV